MYLIMNRRVRLVFIFVIVMFLTFAPLSGSANGLLDGVLVPECHSADESYFNFVGACQLCDLVQLADNIVEFAVAFSVIIATLMFAYAGVLYFTASTSPDNIKKAHGIFIKVFAGLIIILVSWLVVHLFLSVLTGQDLKFWGNIECIEYKKSDPLAKYDGSLSSPPPENASAATACPQGCSPTTIRANSSSCINANGGRGGACLLTSSTNTKLVAMNTALGGTMNITAAIGGGHNALCQNPGNTGSGTCVDAVFLGSRSAMRDPANLARTFAAAQAQGLHADFEINANGFSGTPAERETAARREALRLQTAAEAYARSHNLNIRWGQGAARVIYVGHASGDHYSIYNGSYGVRALPGRNR